jgi:anti-sigma B factor antagonist
LHTAIGVFASRDEAEQAYKLLVERHVPPREIVYLTRSDGKAATASKKISSVIGGVLGAAGGMTAGIGAAMLFAVPGIGQVVALGAGAAALLGLAGAGAAARSRTTVDDTSVKPTPGHLCAEDVEFFRSVLADGHHLIVVRSASQEVANVANGVLSKTGMNMQELTPTTMQASRRQVDDIVIIDLVGRITFVDGSGALRQLVRESIDQGQKKILFNMRGVEYVDSSGLGELVKSYTSVRSNGGHLKLVQASQRVQDLLRVTKLYLVLEIEPDEASALQSFRDAGAAQGAA